MSEVLLSSISGDTVNEQIALAMVAGCDCDAQAAIVSLEASFGPVITKIIELIKSGLVNLPAILAALSALGIVLPPWMSIIIQILLKIVPKPVV